MEKYRINETFYSLQGEGRNTGRAAVFVRFSGCNLKCPFCDTDFTKYQEMSAQDIIDSMKALIGDVSTMPMVVLTGGEPTLQVDESLIDAIHKMGSRLWQWSLMVLPYHQRTLIGSRYRQRVR